MISLIDSEFVFLIGPPIPLVCLLTYLAALLCILSSELHGSFLLWWPSGLVLIVGKMLCCQDEWNCFLV